MALNPLSPLSVQRIHYIYMLSGIVSTILVYGGFAGGKLIYIARKNQRIKLWIISRNFA